MAGPRPYALSIAGFDPSGGAGLLADVKTMEAIKVYGLSVATSITVQNDEEFKSVEWLDKDLVKAQIHVLLEKYTVDHVKIGLVKDLDSLKDIIATLHAKNADIKVIWDPILKSSSGFEVHKGIDKKKLLEVCKSVFLITPNTDEIKKLMGLEDEMKAAKELSKTCNVLLKGGHSEKERGRDHLFMKDGKSYSFRARQVSDLPKHGSGCVLSSAITCFLSRGFTLKDACMKGKNYAERFLMSNKSPLGYHKI